LLTLASRGADDKTKAAASAAKKPAEKAPAPIYDEKADAQAEIKAAVASAKKENRRVLIQWGGNWCPWCHRLFRAFKSDKQIAKAVSYEYDLVLVDIGRREKNMELASRYGADLTKNGIPFLTVLDADGKVLVNQPTESFEKTDKEDKGYQSAKLLEFLKNHQAPYPSAQAVLTASLSAAEHSGKRVFLHFGAPWCGWCRRLDAWMARPEIAALMARDFVDVKIDLDRMTEADSVLKRYCASTEGIPWIVILDAKGKAVIDSAGPKGNIGFPVEDHEIVHFLKMIRASKHSLTDAEVERLNQSLNEIAKDIKRPRKPPA
jgi:thiol-disulfide isomerase/thioredoxin